MPDILKLLPSLKWRNRLYPVSERNVAFTHESVEHRIEYADNVFVEQLGAGSFQFSYTLPMREGLFKGPYGHLFAQGLPQLLKDFRDRSPGPLVDPIYGTYRCTPKLFDETIDVNKRDGTDVKVTFTYDPEKATEVAQPPSMNSLMADLSSVNDGSLTGLLDSLNGMVQQGLGAINKVAYQLDDAAFRLQKLEDSIDQAENPQKWRLLQSLRSTRNATHRMKEQLTQDPLKKTRTITTRFGMTVSAVAANVGMSTADLLALNPGFARIIKVPAGTVVRAA